MYSVSLVTYHHSFAEIKGLLDAVLASTCSCFYIVDNGQDKALEQAVADIKNDRLQYVPMPGNVGFGAGHNAALRKALSAGAEYHMIINPDISFAPGTLEKLIAFMDATPEAALVMPRTQSPDGSLQRNCKLVPSPADLIAKRFLPSFLKQGRMERFMMCGYDYNAVLDVPYLCGCFMVFRCAALLETGLFDERFFMYPEDIDITRRLFSAGYRTLYYPDVEVTHTHTQASYKSIKMLWIHIVNMIRYFNKWGWLRDPERKRLNQRACELNKDKLLKK